MPGRSGAIVRTVPLAPVDENVDKLAIAIEQIWEVRTRLYALKPELKRDLVVEHETDPARYEALSEIHERAARAADEGQRGEAVTLYRHLLAEAKFGFFRLCAEAALYRLGDRGKP